MEISNGETCSDHCKNVENALIKKYHLFLWQYDTPSHSNFFHLPQSLNIDNFLYLLETNINLSLLYFRDMRVED